MTTGGRKPRLWGTVFRPGPSFFRGGMRMLYEGPNKEGFEQEARVLVEHFTDKPEGYRDPDYGKSLEDWAHDLADSFGIGHAEIWDYLPEYEA